MPASSKSAAVSMSYDVSIAQRSPRSLAVCRSRMVIRRFTMPPYRLASVMTGLPTRVTPRCTRTGQWWHALAVPPRWCASHLSPARADGQPPVAAEVLRRDLRPGRVLAPLPLGEVDQPDHLVDDVGVVPGREQVGPAQVALDVVDEDGIEDLVRRQPVLVDLPRGQLG